MAKPNCIAHWHAILFYFFGSAAGTHYLTVTDNAKVTHLNPSGHIKKQLLKLHLKMTYFCPVIRQLTCSATLRLPLLDSVTPP